MRGSSKSPKQDRTTRQPPTPSLWARGHVWHRRGPGGRLLGPNRSSHPPAALSCHRAPARLFPGGDTSAPVDGGMWAHEVWVCGAGVSVCQAPTGKGEMVALGATGPRASHVQRSRAGALCPCHSQGHAHCSHTHPPVHALHMRGQATFPGGLAAAGLGLLGQAGLSCWVVLPLACPSPLRPPQPPSREGTFPSGPHVG